MLHTIYQQIWKTQQWTQGWKRSVFILIQKKGNAKDCSNSHTIALISHPSKEMLKILQARLQQYMNQELPDVQAEFRKGRGTRDQIANICWIIEKARKFQKSIYFSFIDYTKAFDSVKVSHWVMSNSLRPHRLHSTWNSLGQNTGMGSLSLLKGSSQPKDPTQVSRIAGRFFTSWATREAQEHWSR